MNGINYFTVNHGKINMIYFENNMSLLIYDKLKSSEEIIEGTQDEFSISEDNFNNLSETLTENNKAINEFNIVIKKNTNNANLKEKK